MTHDTTTRDRPPLGPGLGLAVVSAAAFGLAGPLASAMMQTGWSAAAAVAVRVLVAGVVLTPFAVLRLRGRWSLLARHAPRVLGFGLVAVAGCQLAYFTAVQYLPVGVALLIEYVSPLAVVGWLWLRRGERPTRLTVLGALVAAVGLVLVLDVIGGRGISLAGVLWAGAAMLGNAFYFVVAAAEGTDSRTDDDDTDGRTGLPGVVLATGGMLVGGLGLLLAGVTGILPLATSARTVVFAGFDAPWWACVGALGAVTAGIAYATGIAATRRLGSRLASFVALGEVVSALVFAWLLLGELPRTVQVGGGALLLLGVVLVKRGEPAGSPIQAGDPADQAVVDPLSGRPGGVATPG